MGDQQQDLLGHRVPGLQSLTDGHLRAHDDITEHTFLWFLVRRCGPQLVHREGQHVCGARKIHPFNVKALDGGLVHKNDVQFSLGMHTHLVEDVGGERRDLGQILRRLESRLVVDFNLIACSFFRGRGVGRDRSLGRDHPARGDRPHHAHRAVPSARRRR